MRRVTACLVVLGFTALVSWPATAQQNVPSTRREKLQSTLNDYLREDSLSRVAKGEEDGSARQSRVRVSGLEGGISALEARDSLTRSEYLEAQRKYYRFRSQSYEFSMEVYRWQHLSSQLIFVVVVSLVLAGLLFSWMQFRNDLRGREVPRKLPAGLPLKEVAGDSLAPPTPLDQSHVKLSTQGLEVSSSVLGVVILVVSLAFFYLYLAYVYPITEVK